MGLVSQGTAVDHESLGTYRQQPSIAPAIVLQNATRETDENCLYALFERFALSESVDPATITDAAYHPGLMF